jgi:two-component system cell cycle response regulator DivK
MDKNLKKGLIMKYKTILVIEDNEINMKLIRTFLEIGKYRILQASDAETGLRLAREKHPDLILMDIQLPGIDGLSAGQFIKSDPDLKKIPIIAVTGNAMQKDKEEAMNIGFAGYLLKPFSIDVFLETIANFFKSQQAV